MYLKISGPIVGFTYIVFTRTRFRLFVAWNIHTVVFLPIFSSYYSVVPCAVCVLSGRCNQSSSALLNVVFESSYRWINVIFNAFLGTLSLSTSSMGFKVANFTLLNNKLYRIETLTKSMNIFRSKYKYISHVYLCIHLFCFKGVTISFFSYRLSVLTSKQIKKCLLYSFWLYNVPREILTSWYLWFKVTSSLSFINEPYHFSVDIRVYTRVKVGLASLNHHHHVTLITLISLTLSRHLSQSSITPRRSSRLHHVSAQSCCI